jgi:asparagine synthase (glutamine-hydrolysing)
MAGGGLDSAGVLAAAVAILRGARSGDVHAIALDFAGPCDDRPYMRHLADELGLTPVRVNPEQAQDILIESLVIDAAPQHWPSGPLELALMRRARELGADVILTGVGGDDVISGDLRSFPRRILRGDLSAVAEAARCRVPDLYSRTSRAWHLVGRPLLRRLIAPCLAPRILERRAVRARRKLQPWAGPRLRDMFEQCSKDVGDPLERGDSLDERRSLLAHSPALDVTVARRRAQLEIASGCRREDPFLSSTVADFALKVPDHVLLHGNQLKGLYRTALRGWVPEALRTRVDKAYFEPALSRMVKGAATKPLLELASGYELGRLGLVEQRPFARRAERLIKAGGSPVDWVTIWPALTVEAFLRS